MYLFPIRNRSQHIHLPQINSELEYLMLANIVNYLSSSLIFFSFFFLFQVSTDLENIDIGLNSKPKSHVTIRRAVLEEIGNRVTTRATQVAKVTAVRSVHVHTGLIL